MYCWRSCECMFAFKSSAFWISKTFCCQCPIGLYREWLEDSEFDAPSCGICRGDITSSKTVRLLCFRKLIRNFSTVWIANTLSAKFCKLFYDFYNHSMHQRFVSYGLFGCVCRIAARNTVATSLSAVRHTNHSDRHANNEIASAIGRVFRIKLVGFERCSFSRNVTCDGAKRCDTYQ